ncbi:hypothetical protein YC2023_019384 [Brassica napus]
MTPQVTRLQTFNGCNQISTTRTAASVTRVIRRFYLRSRLLPFNPSTTPLHSFSPSAIRVSRLNLDGSDDSGSLFLSLDVSSILSPNLDDSALFSRNLEDAASVS